MIEPQEERGCIFQQGNKYLVEKRTYENSFTFHFYHLQANSSALPKLLTTMVQESSMQ